MEHSPTQEYTSDRSSAKGMHIPFRERQHQSNAPGARQSTCGKFHSHDRTTQYAADHRRDRGGGG